MSNTLNNIVAGVARGFRDAVLGTFKVYKLDMAIQADIATKSVEPMTTLARRRSEKMKHKKIEKDRYIVIKVTICTTKMHSSTVCPHFQLVRIAQNFPY